LAVEFGGCELVPGAEEHGPVQFTGQRRRGWAWYSRITGVAFLAGFAATASGSDRPPAVLALWAAVILAWAWVSAVSVFAYRHVAA
jgi:hypothetical protein